MLVSTMKLCFLLLLLCALTNGSIPETVYKSYDRSREGSFECGYAHSSIMIEPSFKLATRLEVTMRENNAKIWVTSSSMIVDQLLLKEWVWPHSTRTFVVGPHEGFYIDLKESACTNETQAFYRFDRVSPANMICDPMLNMVGPRIKIVQYRKPINNDLNCPYMIRPRYENNTIYLSSSQEIQLITNGHIWHTPDTFHIMKNVTSAHFFMNYSFQFGLKKEKWMNEVIAVATDKSCSCGNENFIINATQAIRLKSPGYPDFLCPNSKCSTLISIGEQEELTESGNYTNRLMVSIVSHVHHGVTLSLKQDNFQKLRLDSTTYLNVSTSLLLPESDLTVSYETTAHLSTGLRGHYRMIVRRVLIDKNCDCATLTDNSFKTNFSMKVDIPSDCLMMSCFWRIGSELGSSGELTFGMENGDSHDTIHLWNKNSKQIYNANELKVAKKMVLEDEPSTTQLVFWRTKRGSNATISLSWKSKIVEKNLGGETSENTEQAKNSD
uniref:CUB_2 domain-containing protein n=1 Tax=Caenorhabditis tropicalis TaxID=1561998 RepID=A0A1I7T0S9_9PELO